MINEKLEKLNQEIAKGEARLRRAQHEEKILEHQMKQLTRKERTHRLDRCIVAPLLRKGFPGYPPFHAFCNYFLHATLRKCLFQNVHHILVCQHFRP